MINIIKDIDDINKFVSQFPADTVIGAASVRSIPISTLKAFERDDVNNVLPVIILKGIEYGGCAEEDYYNHYLMAKDRVREIYGDSKKLFEPVIYSNIELWRLFNVRYANYLMRKYDLSNVCLTCRAYRILIQIHMASLFNKKVILENRVNSNSLRIKKEDALDLKFSRSNDRLFQDFSIDAINTLKDYERVEEVAYLLGDKWYFLDKEPSCLFSGAWKDLDRDDLHKHDVPEIVVDKYIYPISNLLIKQLNSNFKTDPKTIDRLISDYLRLI
jgi:hypothetical protein